MKHKHLNQIHSTQTYLKEQLTLNENIDLVSCENQTAGFGRKNHPWIEQEQSLFLSFKATPSVIPSFTALEISVLVIQFFNKYFKIDHKHLMLKWPNDIINSNRKKCGGILIQQNKNDSIVGVGINLFSKDHEFQGLLNEPLITLDKKNLSFLLFEFIINNRFNNMLDLKTNWETMCVHLNAKVTIIEDEKKYEGIFVGIGQWGEALLLINGLEQKFFNGSLRL